MPPDNLVRLLKITIHIPFFKHYYVSFNCFNNVQIIFSELQLKSYGTFLFLLLYHLYYGFFGVSVESLIWELVEELSAVSTYLLAAKNWLSSTSCFPQNLIVRMLYFMEMSNLSDSFSLLKFMKYLCRNEL